MQRTRMKGGSLTDTELVSACLAGDAAAWDALIARYQGLIFGVALRLGFPTADAEDVFQNVALKLCLHLKDLRDIDRLSAWIGAVTRQECFRSRRRAPHACLDDLPEPASEDDLADAVLREERAHLVRMALKSLSPECQALLDLLYGPEPASYAEVSERLSMPMGSIGPRRARCLERLRKNLEAAEK